jgi:hypothetical protein
MYYLNKELEQIEQDADREMFGDETECFNLEDLGCK